jgi:hypothetical protein
VRIEPSDADEHFDDGGFERTSIAPTPTTMLSATLSEIGRSW